MQHGKAGLETGSDHVALRFDNAVNLPSNAGVRPWTEKGRAGNNDKTIREIQRREDP